MQSPHVRYFWHVAEMEEKIRVMFLLRKNQLLYYDPFRATRMTENKIVTP